MKSVSICHAPADQTYARELARFIERNFAFDVSLEDAVITPERGILAATECALSANFAIILFSPASVPGTLKRAEWEPVFLTARLEYRTPIAFVLLRACAFPELLRRRPHFFDFTLDWLTGARSLKRWMMSFDRQIPLFTEHARTPRTESTALAALWPEIVDQPGFAADISADVARALAHEAREDFESVYYVRCAGRPLEVILGELGRALRLRLTGPPEECHSALARHCADHRYLIIFEAPSPDLRGALRFSGRSSIVHVDGADAAVIAAAEEVNASNIAEAMDYALELLTHDPEAGGRLGARIVFVLSEYECYAEADLVLARMQQAGYSRTEYMARERAWIHHYWGESAPVPALPAMQSEQLDLFGDAECPVL